MKFLKKWWSSKSYWSKVTTVYTILFISLYIVSVFNGLLVNINLTLTYPQKNHYTCFGFDVVYGCSLSGLMYNSFFGFPYFYFIILPLQIIPNLLENISSFLEPLITLHISKTYMQEFQLFIIPLLILIYYISVPITILGSIIKNLVKHKK